MVRLEDLESFFTDLMIGAKDGCVELVGGRSQVSQSSNWIAWLTVRLVGIRDSIMLRSEKISVDRSAYLLRHAKKDWSRFDRAGW